MRRRNFVKTLGIVGVGVSIPWWVALFKQPEWIEVCDEFFANDKEWYQYKIIDKKQKLIWLKELSTFKNKIHGIFKVEKVEKFKFPYPKNLMPSGRTEYMRFERVQLTTLKRFSKDAFSSPDNTEIFLRVAGV